MIKSDKGMKVFGAIVILAVIVSVFGGAVSAGDVSGGLKQSVDDAEIQTEVGNLSSEELTEALNAVTDDTVNIEFADQSAEVGVLSSRSSYDPQAAVNYAEVWWNGRNSNNPDLCDPYMDYGGYDCANFVSQCLIAGGLDLSTGTVDDCRCIIRCTKLNEYLVNQGAERVQWLKGHDPIEPDSFRPGDPAIFGYTDNEGDVHLYAHSVIAVTGDDTHYTTCNAHSSNAHHERIQDFYDANPSFDRCTFYHIPTQPVQKPTVETRSATSITETAATLNGEITDDGGASIDERRFSWGTTSSCSDGWITDDPSSDHYGCFDISGNSFSYRLTGLESDKTYYFQAWAHNSAGWSNGAALSFTTLPQNQPPIAHASDLSNQPDVMHPDTLYEVTAKYYDPDGRANLDLCTLELYPLRPSDIIMMGWDEDHKMPIEDSPYITYLDVVYTQITDSYEGYQLTWKFKLSDTWPEAENCIDFCVLATDDDGLRSGLLPDCDNTDASFVVIVPTCDGTATSCGIYPNCENCNEDDSCYPSGDGCEERNYYCVSNEAGCSYTPSNRHTDYYDDWDYYCDGDTIRKHRLWHNYYCDAGTCTDHTRMEDDQLVENCNDHDGWVDTGNTDWAPDPGNDCQEKEKKEQKYRDYYCSGGACTYDVTATHWVDTGTTQNKDDGTICDCTASNTLKTCNGGVCTDTGICDSTTCGADVACDGKVPGDSCGGERTCDSNCKCGVPPVGDDIAVYIGRTFYISTNLGTSGEKGVDLWYNFGVDGAKPLVGDFDQDGYDDIAVYIGRTFYISTNLGTSGEKGVDLWYNFGVDGAKPLVGDFNRDGYDDIAVYIGRTFYINTNLGTSGEKGVDLWYNFGQAGAIPLVGDFNRDGYDDIAVYIDRTFYISTNLGTSGEKGVDLWYNFGVDGAKPLVGDFDQDGYDDIAVYIGRTFYISTNLGTSGEKGVDLWYNFGQAGAIPLVGDIG